MWRSRFCKRLLAVMAERDARTAGARTAAAAAVAAAAAKIKQYQEALKQARAQVYAEQRAARKKVLDERAALVKEARSKAATEVTAGKDRIAKELAAALREIQASVGPLAAEIARRVLQIAPRAGGPARGARGRGA